MAWTAVASPYFSTGQVVNATNMNALSDNLRYLKGTDGPTVLEDRLTIPLTSGGNGKGLRFGDGTNQYANLQGMDLSSNSFVFFGTNRQYDGSAWQQLNTRAGGVVQITQDEFIYFTFPASSSTPAERFRIKNTGYVGIGTNAPTGPLHLVGSLGRWAAYEFDGLAGTTQVVVPDGTGDVVYGLLVTSLVRGSGGIVQVANSSGTVISPGGNTALYSNGGDAAQLRVLANGQIEIQRTAGALTYKVALWMQWM